MENCSGLRSRKDAANAKRDATDNGVLVQSATTDQEQSPTSWPRGPFTVQPLDKFATEGPRSASPSDTSSDSSTGDEDDTPVRTPEGTTVVGHGPLVIQTQERTWIQDLKSVGLVCLLLVPCFTVFAPLSVLAPCALRTPPRCAALMYGSVCGH
jgi:hypothetical protein